VAYFKVLIHISPAKIEKKNYESGLYGLKISDWSKKNKKKNESESERNISLF
jgi:hypothetical protein